ncbi:MAG: endopeptidase La [Chloroflexota bacterium]|nr:endopeptidase La [Chloroflexota bacterium]
MSSDVPRGKEFPLLPLKNVVVFPRTLVTLTVGRPRSIRALEEAAGRDRRLVVATQRAGQTDDPEAEDIYEAGTLVEVGQVQRQADGNLQVSVEGLRRVRVDSYGQSEPFFTVQVSDVAEQMGSGPVVDALMRHLVELFSRYAAMNSKVPAEAVETVRAVRHPGYLADLLAAHVVPDAHERQAVLEQTDHTLRLEHVGAVLTGELDVLELDQRIRNKVRSQIDKNQREFYLREQLKAIHDELAGEGGNELTELRDKLEAARLPDDAAAKVRKEINRLERMPSASPEGTVIRNYIDWILALPWTERTTDVLDTAVAEQVLDSDHYGLDKIKERILEFLAVRQLTQAALQAATASGDAEAAGKGPNLPSSAARKRRLLKGPLLCFVGPPGVGKTSLGQSIADSMGRRFVRIALGGVHDEAEIRGHRRTYVGAMPGRIIQGMKTAGTRNPLILLDEIDKLASDYRGDPASALLEVLDPEQNWNFNDHYLDLPYDLSEVLFITTANNLQTIPRPLRDRMEIIELSGYTEDEKVQIARRYLLPRQLQAHGLPAGAVEIPEKMLRLIIHTHTREAGVRDLERKLAAICRKAARRVVLGRTTRVRVTPHNLAEFLGPGRLTGELESLAQIGVALGLAWTEHGGQLLPVEVATMPGHGSLTITGQLGEVMQESARAALSYARSRADALHIDPDFQEKTDLHIHLPEGAIPKDGPSAGITMAAALVSALTRRPLRHDTAMTGEITLRGRVLPIGGLKEKVLAAHRAGIKRVIAPADNRRDLLELPRNVRREITFLWVETMDQVLEAMLIPPADAPAVVPGMTPTDLAPTLGLVDPAGVPAPAAPDLHPSA